MINNLLYRTRGKKIKRSLEHITEQDTVSEQESNQIQAQLLYRKSHSSPSKIMEFIKRSYHKKGKHNKSEDNEMKITENDVYYTGFSVNPKKERTDNIIVLSTQREAQDKNKEKRQGKDLRKECLKSLTSRVVRFRPPRKNTMSLRGSSVKTWK